MDSERFVYRSETDEEDNESYIILEGGDELSDYEEDDDESDSDDEVTSLNYCLKTVTEAEHEDQMTDSCCFCLEEFKRADAVTTDCEHSFCTTCYESFRNCPRTTARQKRTCPCCRKWVVKLTTYQKKQSNSDDFCVIK